MKKKLLICTLLSATALSVAALAGCGIFGGKGGGNDDVVQDNMRFKLKDDGTYELARYEYAYLRDGEDADGNYVEGYKGGGERVTVPDTVKGKAVTSVRGYAFAITGVKEVTLPDAVSELPDRIFDGCELLEKVKFSNVTSIGELAFMNCTSLKSISFGSGLTSIGDRAFEDCTSLTEITLPDTVTRIGDNCFLKCQFDGINTAGVEQLGRSAFYQCVNITEINLPNVVSIGEYAFRYCNSLAELTIGDKLKDIPKRPFVNNDALRKINISSPVPEEFLTWNETVTEVNFGEGVTSIGASAFAYSKGVTTITFPSTLTEICDRAFGQSELGGTVTIPASVKTIGEGAFVGTGVQEFIIENGVEDIKKSAFEGTAITSLSLPASVKYVGDDAFRYCNHLTQITLSENLESIGGAAFSIVGAETLEIVLPSTVKSIGDNCFGGITANKIIINDTVESVGTNILKNGKVKELKAPANYGHNVTSVETLTLFGEGEIPANAYQNCTALKTVALGGGVKKIGGNAFKAIETITLGGVEYMGYKALGDLSTLTCLETENGVKTLDNWVIATDYSAGGATNLDLSGYTGIYHNAFLKTDTNDTSVLDTVALVGSDDTSNLKFIGEYAFYGSGITAVEVPASVEEWKGAFRGCKSLSVVAIQRGVKKIAESAFTDCTNLQSISFGNVEEIGYSAFSGCINMRLLTLPNSVKKIGSYAFSGCNALMQAQLGGVEEIAEYAFSRCTRLSEVVMNSVKKIGGSAFYMCTELTEFDLPTTVTEIAGSALGNAETVNYAGTPGQWAAIAKGGKYDRYIWYSDNDLELVFGDGSSATLHKSES